MAKIAHAPQESDRDVFNKLWVVAGVILVSFGTAWDNGGGNGYNFCLIVRVDGPQNLQLVAASRQYQDLIQTLKSLIDPRFDDALLIADTAMPPSHPPRAGNYTIHASLISLDPSQYDLDKPEILSTWQRGGMFPGVFGGYTIAPVSNHKNMWAHVAYFENQQARDRWFVSDVHMAIGADLLMKPSLNWSAGRPPIIALDINHDSFEAFIAPTDNAEGHKSVSAWVESMKSGMSHK